MNSFTEHVHQNDPGGGDVLRADQKEETRRAILVAARALFERLGFAKTAIRDVANAAGVATGTVLLHFADKSDLLHAALFEELEHAVDELLTTLPRGSLERQLTHITRRMFSYYEQRPTLSRTLLSESLFAPPPWAQRFSAQVAKVQRAIVNEAQQARERGELAPDSDCEALGLAYFSFYYFALIAWVQGAHPEPVALVAQLTRQHLRGLQRAPNTKAKKKPNERRQP